MRELSRRGDLSPSYVSDILAGRQEPGVKFYVGIAKAFGLTMTEVERLAQNGEIPSKPAEIVKEISQLAQELPDEEKRLVYDFAKWRVQIIKERKSNEQKGTSHDY